LELAIFVYNDRPMSTEIKKAVDKAPHVGLKIFYYGKGKGKTTAAMGLAARAAGAGMDVFILQFVKAARLKKGEERKGGEWPLSNEIYYFENTKPDLKKIPKGKRIGTVTTEQMGRGFVGILGDAKERGEHVKAAQAALKRAREVMKSGNYGLVIMDELVSALELKLISQKDILDLLKVKPKDLHIAYTGHDVFPKIIAASDLVSEITMVKHPYYKGILAQRGIDF
jgi:cob(I)alamin adenosyltransferase